jgi:pilus assembly protein CpaC
VNTRTSKSLSILTIISTLAVSSVNLPELAYSAEPQQGSGSATAEPSSNDLAVVVGKSVVVNSEQAIERVSVGFGEIAEATAVSPHEVLVNAKAPGSTSMIVWQQGGGKLYFDVNVRPNQFLMNTRLGTVRREIAKELPGQDINVSSENDTIFLRGTAKDLLSVQRATSIAATSGKVLNLMYVDVPAPEAQILLKVRFASLDRTLSSQLGMNLFSTGASNTIGSTSTQQFPAPTLPPTPQPGNVTNPFVFSNLLNIFLFRKDINLGATIQALEAKGVLQILAEPDVLAENGKQASFLAGGEVPYPVFQGVAGGAGSVTIQFREFGVRLNFIPTITPNGTVRLQVAPEVSSLDFSNGIVIQGFNVPALSSRKMQTTVDLQDGQSFAIGGLLDKRVTSQMEKVPFIGDLPIIGKMFQSKSVTRTNSELLVIVTPELVRPMPVDAARPEIHFPAPFMPTDPKDAVQTPGMAATGPVPVVPPNKSIPVENLIQSMKPQKPLVITNGTSMSTTAAPEPQDTSAPNQTIMQVPMSSPPPQ